MSQHSLSYINQKKLYHLGTKRHFSINAEVAKDGTRFTVNFYDPIKSFNPDAKVYVQPYVKGGQSLENFYYGAINNLKDSKDNTIENFKPTELLFRIRISHNDFIIARADSISPILADESAERSSIIGVREKEMDEIYKIENEPGEKPVIIFKKGTNLLNEFRNNHIIKALILTAAVRNILSDYLKLIDHSGQSKAEMLLNYFEEITGNEYPKLTEEQKSKQDFINVEEWIDLAIITFNKKPIINSNSLLEMFERSMSQLDDKDDE